MKIKTQIAGLFVLLLVGCASSNPQSDQTVVARPVPPIALPADPELAALRAQGPAGLKQMLDAHEGTIEGMRNMNVRLDDPRVMKLRAAVDAVAKQRDAFASGLYWYTDLDAAKAEAKRTKRHILSLRLLGNLDEEYSCANSRFFRVVLYANGNVSEYLREHYVLHWKSVRPAPLVTIDMGDGRRLKRTITGNSIHYVLDSDGTVLDALPGLYGPASFLAALARSENLWSPDADTFRHWHGQQADALYSQWLDAAVRGGLYSDEFASRLNRGVPGEIESCLNEAFPGRHLPAMTAAQQTAALGEPQIRLYLPIAKTMVEAPMQRQIAPGSMKNTAAPPPIPPPVAAALPPKPSDSDKRPLAQRMNDEAWQKLASLRLEEAKLDMSSKGLMFAKRQPAHEPAAKSEQDYIDVATALFRMVANFENAIALDTVHNEYTLHTQIHQWLEQDAGDTLRHDVEALNKRVYTELFLTPDHDAWLGLVPADTYTALEKDGCACDKNAPPMK